MNLFTYEHAVTFPRVLDEIVQNHPAGEYT